MSLSNILHYLKAGKEELLCCRNRKFIRDGKREQDEQTYVYIQIQLRMHMIQKPPKLKRAISVDKKETHMRWGRVPQTADRIIWIK